MGWNYGWGPGWGGGLIMLIMMILFWGGLITVAVLFIRRFGRPPHHTDSARRILNERFARGEIDAEEYQRRRDTLHDH